MKIDCVRFYVDDAQKWRDWFVRTMQFSAVAGGRDGQSQIEVVRCGAIAFVLCSPLTAHSPVAEFLRHRPPGVVDVTFLVPDIDGTMQRAIAHNVKIIQPIECKEFPQGRLRWSKIAGATSVCHTLIERRGITPIIPENGIETVNFEPPAETVFSEIDPVVFNVAVEESETVNFEPPTETVFSEIDPVVFNVAVGEMETVDFEPPTETIFSEIDHIVFNVAVGELEKTVEWYEEILGFERQQSFTIKTERSGLYSQVLVHPESGVQMPVNEPTSANSQIQEFLDFNGGSGVQHIALKTDNIIQTIAQLQKAGLPFLEVPPSYYIQQQKRYGNLKLSHGEWEKLARSQILIEGQTSRDGNAPILLQIFTKPIFDQPTFFFESIERRDRARGFGEGNFRALFEAIEKEQAKRGKL
ncbi:MAG: VOC family protein [Cyanobacteriota bacterium]|nr:VOC family protein [Cyanobacteriota bacterium]